MNRAINDMPEERVHAADPDTQAMEILTRALGAAELEGQVSDGEAKWLSDYLGVLQRRARRSLNQRTALRQLNRSHRFLRSELDMVRLLHGRVLNTAVEVLHESGFTVPTALLRSRLGLEQGVATEPRLPHQVPVPCGKVQREKGMCQQGNLCDHCTYIVKLEDRLGATVAEG